MDEADPKAGARVIQLGEPDAPADALLKSLRLLPDLQFISFSPSPTFEGNKP